MKKIAAAGTIVFCIFIQTVVGQTAPYRASHLIGLTISSPAQFAGTINDLVFDEKGGVTSLVIDQHGKLVLMPWESFSNHDDRVRSYYGQDAEGQDSTTWHQKLDKALREVPQ